MEIRKRTWFERLLRVPQTTWGHYRHARKCGLLPWAAMVLAVRLGRLLLVDDAPWKSNYVEQWKVWKKALRWRA